jgi:hypothetical protein
MSKACNWRQRGGLLLPEKEGLFGTLRFNGTNARHGDV